MIEVYFQQPDTENWRAWLDLCQKEQQAHNKAIADGKPSEVKRNVYKGERYGIKQDVFLNPSDFFYGKCAYCESKIAADQPGDIEHFRPKSTIKDSKNQNVMIETNGGSEPHPGYYWLAYDWHNLLPSCRDCNSISKRKTGGKQIGKGNQFPVKGFHAKRPGEEVKEEPLLINPTIQNPEEHLEVDETGLIKSKNNSEFGEACINIFGLNMREALIEGRKDAFDNAKNKADMLFLHMTKKSDEVRPRYEKIIDSLKGKKAYSAAECAAIERRLPFLKELYDLNRMHD